MKVSLVLACIDGSHYSRSVAQQAAWAAARLGAPIELMLVDDGAVTDDRSNDGPETVGRVEPAERGRLDLEEAQVRVEAAGVLDSSLTLLRGDLVEALAAAESRASLIVIGKRGAAADYQRGDLGSNLERVARSVRRPLMIASRRFRPPRRMAIALDSGPSSGKAIEDAATSKLYAGLDCDVISVGVDTTELRHAQEAACSRLRAAGILATPHVLTGEPAKAIAAFVEAQGVDLLLMGAYSHSRLRTLVLGSTTAELIRSCRIPIVLYR